MYNGGRAPFGYLSTNKELVVSNAQKPIVEHIFKVFVDTHSTVAVANYLNDAKLLHPSRKPWKDTSIECILKNPTYKGMVVWKKEAYPGNHPPLIATSVWDTVQAIFLAQKRLSPATKSDSLLQKLVTCGHCKTPLTPSFSYNRAKTKYWYYRCSSTIHGQNYSEKAPCTFKYMAFPKLNLALQNAIQTLVEPLKMAELDSRVFSHNQTLTSSIKTLLDQVQRYEEESKSTKAKKNEYIDALVIKQFSAQDHQKIHERIQELDTELKKQHAQISQNQLEITQFQNQLIHTETLKETLLKLRDTPQTNPDYRSTLQSIIKQIEVSTQTLIFHFKTLPWTVEITLNTS
jgi:flagellar biosynthesis chaperone FliJ